MTRWLLTLASLAFTLPLFAAEPPAAPAIDPPAAPAVIAAGQAVADAVLPKDATVRVSVGNGHGSGVCVWSDEGYSLVLTCRHVTDGGGATTVTHKQTRYVGNLMDVDDRDDLALVWLEGEIPVASVAASYPAAGESLTLWGHGNDGGALKPKTGKAIGYGGAKLLTGGPVYEAGFLSIPGDSGGGVFNVRGELVAINWGNDGTKSSCAGLTATRTFIKVKAGPRFPRLARVFGRVPVEAPAPAKPAPAASSPAKCVPGCPCPNNPPAAAPAPKSVPYTLPGFPGVSNCPGGVCNQPGVIYYAPARRR